MACGWVITNLAGSAAARPARSIGEDFAVQQPLLMRLPDDNLLVSRPLRRQPAGIYWEGIGSVGWRPPNGQAPVWCRGCSGKVGRCSSASAGLPGQQAMSMPLATRAPLLPL